MHGTITDWINHHADRTPLKLATFELPSGRTQTYADMHDRIGRIAGWLSSLGISRGDRVGVLVLNSTDVLDIIFATWRIGAVHLALNFRLTPMELDFILSDSEPKLLIYDETLSGAVDQLSVKLPDKVATKGNGEPSEFETLIAGQYRIEAMVDLDPDEQSILMYSSGTTGRPKGVIITHGMVLWAQYNLLLPGRCGEDMVNLNVMPLFHIAGLQAFALPAMFFGGTVIIGRSFSPDLVLDALLTEDLGVTHFAGVPAIHSALKDHPKTSRVDFSKLRVCLVGAEAAPVPLITWWHERGMNIREGFGMTELTGVGTLLGDGDMPGKVGSVGKPMRHTEIKIVRTDGTNTEAGVGEAGELWFRGPTVTPGYWNNDSANRESYVDGWFRSGDIGSMDEDGFIYIEDRLKDMYISGGENVYPKEIENILYDMEEIQDVAVIGVPDSRWGEAGCATIVVKKGVLLTAEAVLLHCERKLARFKQPKHVIFMETLPRNATGKVLKSDLREAVAVLLTDT